MPVIYILLFVVLATPSLLDAQASGGLSFLLLPVSLFAVGFRATARLWYLRIWRDSQLAVGQAWSVSWRFLGRMFVLGLIVVVPMAVVVGLGYAAASASGLSRLAALTAAVAASGFVADVVLTFIVPALVFSTPSAGIACQLGLRMLRQHWRHAWPYLITPPLALQAVSQLPLAVNDLPVVYLALQVVISLIDLAFKGAIAAYYLRHAPTPVCDSGSLSRPNEVDPSEPVPDYGRHH
jgi:hypothetical protein